MAVVYLHADQHRFQPKRANQATLCWLPSFLSADRLADLGELVVIRHVLERDWLRENTKLMTEEDRYHARIQVGSCRNTPETRFKDVLKKGYGLAAHDGADSGSR